MMSWLQFWKRSTQRSRDDETLDADASQSQEQRMPNPPGAGRSPTAADGSPPGMAPSSRTLPPHMQKIVDERKTSEPTTSERRLERLRRERLAMIYDVEQGELAASDDNPWLHRIQLLSEALETVDQDTKAVATAHPAPYHPVPPAPISELHVETEPVATVAFNVGDQPFYYAEERDWAERGHTVTPTELIRQEGDPATLVPDDTPESMRQPLERHLTDSLFSFASDLRDRTLEEEPLPSGVTLSDMASPCPVCGGWADWRGRCQVCAAREAESLLLRREQNRLLSERAEEAEERHRLAERLPIALRRLRDTEAEIEKLEQELA